MVNAKTLLPHKAEYLRLSLSFTSIIYHRDLRLILNLLLIMYLHFQLLAVSKHLAQGSTTIF